MISGFLLALVLAAVVLTSPDGASAVPSRFNLFRSNKPFKRLEKFLKDSTCSRQLDHNLQAVDEYLRDFDRANDPNNQPLTRAADEFSKLANLRWVFQVTSANRKLCSSGNTKILVSLREQLERDFKGKLNTIAIRLGRVAKLHQDTAERYATLCLAHFIDEWAQFDTNKELFGAGDDSASASQVLAALWSAWHDLSLPCSSNYQGFRLPLRALLCESKKKPRPLKDMEIWPIVEALDDFLAAQRERQPDASLDQVDSLSQLVAVADSERKVDELLDRTLLEPCQRLASASIAGPKILWEVVDLVELLPDTGLVPEGVAGDNLLEWSRRQHICRRLLELSKGDKLAKQVVGFVEHETRQRGAN